MILLLYSKNRGYNMNYQNILKKQTSIILISVIFMVLIIIGVSYSLFMQVDESKDIQVLESGTLVLSTTKGNTITTSTVPQSDYDGMNTEGYTFSIKNTGTLDCFYTLYISNIASNPLDYQYLRISIDGNNPIVLTDLDIDPDNSSRFIFENGKLSAANQEGDVITHNIKVWIDELAPASIIGKKIQLQIDLYGEVSTIYEDDSGAAVPELYAGLIPVTYDEENNMVVADIYSEWYNYDNHEWANAILIDQSNTDIKNKYLNNGGTYKFGTKVEETDILQMYVWIPRYKYKLFNATRASTSAQMIEVEFESSGTAKSTGSTNGEWLTHPAFTFGETELNGIWVGKFESSGSTSDITIKPNVSSLRSITLGVMFNASREIEATAKYGLSADEIDTHMMKNMEWGAVAYLTNSKYGRYIEGGNCISSGCEVWKNNNSNYTTGCAGGSVSESPSSSCNHWNTSTEVNASTTGTIYGIYDMSGGTWEYVMGNYNKTVGSSEINFSEIENKYYDIYTGTSTSYGNLGDATKETSGWNGDYANFVYSSNPWFLRGGSSGNGSTAGVFSFENLNGAANYDLSFRVVLVRA